MDTHKFFVEKLRFHLNEPDMLVFVGWFYDGKASGREVQAYLDGEKLPAALTVNKGAEVRQKYLGTINEINEEVVGIVTLPSASISESETPLAARYARTKAVTSVCVSSTGRPLSSSSLLTERKSSSSLAPPETVNLASAAPVAAR